MILREGSPPRQDNLPGYAPARNRPFESLDSGGWNAGFPQDELAFTELGEFSDLADEDSQDWGDQDLQQLYNSVYAAPPSPSPAAQKPAPAVRHMGLGSSATPGVKKSSVAARETRGPVAATNPGTGQSTAAAGKSRGPEAATNPGAGQSTSASSNTLNLPPRPEGAMTGREFMERTRNLSRSQREALILEEIQKGNVPQFARQMREIQLNHKGHTGTLRVMPDYLAIGSDQDFVRIPMDPKTAQKIADQTGTSLPTPKMVDDIYRQADNKLTPQPLPAGAQMMSNDYYQRHNTMVEQQMAQRGAEHGQLTAGHQKDVVISNRLNQHPDRVAIYGWHQPNGKPIQPLSTVHENSYADYSHGVRLVGGTMVVDGVERPLAEVLQDPELAGLVSNEGALRNPRVPGV